MSGQYDVKTQQLSAENMMGVQIAFSICKQ